MSVVKGRAMRTRKVICYLWREGVGTRGGVGSGESSREGGEGEVEVRGGLMVTAGARGVQNVDARGKRLQNGSAA